MFFTCAVTIITKLTEKRAIVLNTARQVKRDSLQCYKIGLSDVLQEHEYAIVYMQLSIIQLSYLD